MCSTATANESSQLPALSMHSDAAGYKTCVVMRRHCAGGSNQKVISADKHIVNIWDASTAQNMTSLQPQAPGINDVLHWKGSGLIMLGLDAPRIQACPLLLHPSLSPAGAPVHASLVCCCSLNA